MHIDLERFLFMRLGDETGPALIHVNPVEKRLQSCLKIVCKTQLVKLVKQSPSKKWANFLMN